MGQEYVVFFRMGANCVRRRSPFLIRSDACVVKCTAIMVDSFFPLRRSFVVNTPVARCSRIARSLPRHCISVMVGSSLIKMSAIPISATTKRLDQSTSCRGWIAHLLPLDHHSVAHNQVTAGEVRDRRFCTQNLPDGCMPSWCRGVSLLTLHVAAPFGRPRG